MVLTSSFAKNLLGYFGIVQFQLSLLALVVLLLLVVERSSLVVVLNKIESDLVAPADWHLTSSALLFCVTTDRFGIAVVAGIAVVVPLLRKSRLRVQRVELNFARGC